MTCNKPIYHVSCCEVAHMEQVHYTRTCSITCKHCGSTNVMKYGTKGRLQYYKCNDCHRKFAGNNAIPGVSFVSGWTVIKDGIRMLLSLIKGVEAWMYQLHLSQESW